jgi:hypothetical protein
MEIQRIREEMRKINGTLSIQKKEVFLKAEKNVNRLLKEVNSLNQRDINVIETKKELTNMCWYIRNTIRFYFMKPRTLRVKKRKRKTAYNI